MKVSLNEISESVVYGVSASACGQPLGPKFLRITDIQDGRVDWGNVPWCQCTDKQMVAAQLRKGDIVFARTGATTGKSFLIDNCPDETVFASYLIRVRLLDLADSSYVGHFFQSSNYWRQISQTVRGVAQPGINATTLKSLQIPLPPLQDQKRIADILDKADALRRKRAEALRLADDFLKSTFLDMFGDPVTNPMGWPLKPLAELGSLDRGVSKHRPRNEPSLLGGPYPLIQTGDVANSQGYVRNHSSTYSEIGLQQSKLWPAGTLCITIAANIANTGILTYDSCFPDSVVGFKHNELSTVEFVQGLFGFFRKILEEKAPQVAQKNINLKILRELEVPCPPIKLQNRFSDVIRKTNFLIEKNRKSGEELKEAFGSIQQQFFGG